MPKDQRFPARQRPARPSWAFDRGIPTSEWLEGQPLDKMWNLQEAVEIFVYMMERGDFLAWEAVACKEQGLALTTAQEESLAGLMRFNNGDHDGKDDRILYIDSLCRPSKPWDQILNQIVPHLLIEPFDTSGEMWEVKTEGFPKLMDAVRKHGQGLSLPPGVNSHEEVVTVRLWHKMWLQFCFDALAGLGQAPEINLAEQPERIEWFIEHLREHKESVQFFGLTLESLLKQVILPDADRPIFVKLMQEQLSLASVQELITPHL